MTEVHLKHNRFFHVSNILFVVITVLSVGLGFFLLRSNIIFGKCQRLSCLELPKTAVLTLTQVYEEVRGSVFRARYEMGDVIVRVDVRSDVDPEASEDYIKGRIAGMKALYDNIRSPYPGLLSNEIECDAEYKPSYDDVKTASGLVVKRISGYLNDRMVFGSCQKDQAVYRGEMVLFACADRRQLYQLEFIAPLESYSVDETNLIIGSITCQ